MEKHHLHLYFGVFGVSDDLESSDDFRMGLEDLEDLDVSFEEESKLNDFDWNSL